MASDKSLDVASQVAPHHVDDALKRSVTDVHQWCDSTHADASIGWSDGLIELRASSSHGASAVLDMLRVRLAQHDGTLDGVHVSQPRRIDDSWAVVVDPGPAPTPQGAAGSRQEKPASSTPAEPPRAVVPAPGPPWFGSVMGTGILATLLQTFASHLPGAGIVAIGLLTIGWVLLVGLTTAFVVRVVRKPSVLAETVRNITTVVTWGMVAMGYLAVGAATATVIPAHWPSLSHVAWTADAVLWTLGTVLGFITAVGFALRLIGSDVGAPSTTWGLAIVPPMVSATTGTAFIPHIEQHAAAIWLLVTTVVCFFLALVLGLLVFAVAYHHHWRVSPVALAASTSTWIPLGVVGQSTAAAQSIAHQSAGFVRPEHVSTIQQIANVYGFVMLSLAIPLIMWATIVTVRGFMRRMPFVPGWWALTFPLGTVSLGSHLLATGSGVPVMEVVAVAVCLALVGTWILCAVASGRAVRIASA